MKLTEHDKIAAGITTEVVLTTDAYIIPADVCAARDAERDCYRKALEPFAEIVEYDDFKWRERWVEVFNCTVKVSDIEQAAAALEGEEDEDAKTE